MLDRAAREAGRGLAIAPSNNQDRDNVSRNRRDAGFTLVEMLVVLTLTAAMAAMMLAGIRQMQTWAQVQKRETAHSALEAVADHMSGELAGALSLPLLDGASDAFIPMTGTSENIRFMAVIRTGFSVKALRETSYYTKPSSTGAVLMRTSRPHRIPRQGEAPQIQAEELYKGIGKLKLGYLTRDTANKLIWFDTWAKQSKLPIAVRIEISKFVDGFDLKVSRTVSIIH